MFYSKFFAAALVVAILMPTAPAAAKPLIKISPTVETTKIVSWRLKDVGKPPTEDIAVGLRAEGVMRTGVRWRLSFTPNPKKIVSIRLVF